MRRVAVTGLGAITPIGLDAPSTWRAAVAGESGIDFIAGLRRERVPGPDRGRGEGLRPGVGRAAEGGDGGWTATSCSRSARRRRPGGTPGSTGSIRRASASSSARRSAACRGSWSSSDVLRERGPDRVSPFFIPSVLVDSASGQIAISLGLRGPNYAPVSACATGSHAVGEGAELIRRGDADAVLAGGTESCIHPLILAGFCAMRGLVAEDEDPTKASRPFDATRAGFVMSEGACILAARGARGGAGARRDDLRRGARLRRLERRAPHGAARARGSSASRR